MFNDYVSSLRRQLLSTVTTVTTGAIAASALALSVGRSEVAKLVGFTTATAASGLAVYHRRESLLSDDTRSDHYTAIQLRRQRGLLDTPVSIDKPGQPAFSGEGLFDWKELASDRTKYPVVFVAGKPGSGKTTLAEYLGVLGATGKRYVISPHLKPKDFAGFDGHFGGGGNYVPNGSFDPADSLDQLTRMASVYEAMLTVESVVFERLKAYSTGQEDFDPIDIYVDETIAISKYFANRCKDKSLRKYWSTWMTFMLTEPRKVGVRLFVLTQSATAASIGLDGLNALKTEFVWIRLNHAAVNHAKYLRRRKEVTESEWLWIQSQPRPVLVDEFLAVLPSYAEQRAAIAAAADARKNETTNETPVTPMTTPADPGNDPATTTTPADPGNDAAVLMPKDSSGSATDATENKKNGLPAINEVLAVPDAAGSATPIDLEETAKAVGLDAATVATLQTAAIGLLGSEDLEGRRWTKTRIISEVWTGQHGIGRNKARQLWALLFPE